MNLAYLFIAHKWFLHGRFRHFSKRLPPIKISTLKLSVMQGPVLAQKVSCKHLRKNND